MKYYIDARAKLGGDGSREFPFRKIQDAANIAQAGDEILVMPGIYRESVHPVSAGTRQARIVYRSMEPLQAIITGADRVDHWQQYDGDVWKIRIPNDYFGTYNPYLVKVEGDWYYPLKTAHTGDVFLNHKSMYEQDLLEKVISPQKDCFCRDPEFSVYTWYTEQNEEDDETIIYANFHGRNPNKEEVEISVRQNCFMPEEEGIGYITLSGFTVREAATQWAPPTAYQDGMIGPHWSKGWIIEDCDIYESKCSGISLGKNLQPDNDNKWLKWKYKDGTQTERECICQASYEGWDKEHIGSHQIRRCHIHDCGQTGIVGHLGGVFSVIENNHIHHINHKRNLNGAEIAGIKMHAAIDVIYRANRIHHCTRGMWLDWQAQGTRVTQNIFYENQPDYDQMAALKQDQKKTYLGMVPGEDIFIEVSHGPTLIDHNILLSRHAVKICAQGVALVHNFIAGSFSTVGGGIGNGAKTLKSSRYTPYHEPHDTKVKGFMTFLHGDCRFYNNIFVQQKLPDVFYEIEKEGAEGEENWCWEDNNYTVGTLPYNDYPTYDEWRAMYDGYCGMGSPESDRYYAKMPVWSKGNVFLDGAKPCKNEENYVCQEDAGLIYQVKEREDAAMLGKDGVIFEMNLSDIMGQIKQEHACDMVTTKTLGSAFEPEEAFENPDGSPIIFNEDYNGKMRASHVIAGPFA